MNPGRRKSLLIPVRDLFDRSGFLKGLNGRLFRGVDVDVAVATFLGAA